jgi:catechol-2,3-dioxygenase
VSRSIDNLRQKHGGDWCDDNSFAALHIDHTLNSKRGSFMAQIRHLAIVSANRERLVEFYTKVFGMKQVESTGPAIYLTDGYINLALIQKRPHNKEGLYHFGFVVDDIEALKPLCKELGAASDVEDRPFQAETRVHDPDGNGVDVSLRGWPVT